MSRLGDAAAVLLGRATTRALTDADFAGLVLGQGRALRAHGPAPSHDAALQHSGVWAALRLRANLISSLPLDVQRNRAGFAVVVPTPGVLMEPSPGVGIGEWVWGSQHDLDRYGNAWGVIVERDGRGLPSRVDLVPAASVRALVRDGQIVEVRTGAATIPLSDLWHERQYAPAGQRVGMSPVQYAAWALRTHQAASENAAMWYESDGSQPRMVLKSTARELTPRVVEGVRAAYRAATAVGDPLVVGREWEWTSTTVEADHAGFLATLSWGMAEVARFFDVPVDLIDGAVDGSSLTYANIGQRNLQLLITSLGPAIGRRERALSTWLPRGQRVRFTSDALLRMDPETRSRVLLAEVAGRVRTPSEVRALHDLEPFTAAQIAEFDVLFGGAGPLAPAVPDAPEEGP